MGILGSIHRAHKTRQERKKKEADRKRNYQDRAAAFVAPASRGVARTKKAIEFIQSRAHEQVHGYGRLRNEFSELLAAEHAAIFDTINERIAHYHDQLNRCPKGSARYRFLKDLIARLGGMKLYAMAENEDTFDDTKIRRLKKFVGDQGKENLVQLYALKYAFHEMGLEGVHRVYLEKIDQVAEGIKKSIRAERITDEAVRKELSSYLFQYFRHYFKNTKVARKFVDTYLQIRKALSE